MAPQRPPSERQTSFAAGELAESLHGRTDISLYRAGARKLRNFIVTPYGALVNRAGTQHIVDLKSLGLENSRAVGWWFECGDDDELGPTRLLIFTDRKMQVFYEDPDDPRHVINAATTVQTSYLEAHLKTLRFSQFGNTVTITSPHYVQQEIVRSTEGGETWSAPTIASVDAAEFGYGADLLFHGDWTQDPGVGAEAPPSILEPVGINLFSTLVQSLLNGTSTTGLSYIAPNYVDADPAAFPGREWQWAVTRVIRDQNGNTFETEKVVVTKYISDLNESTEEIHYDTIPAEIAIYPERTKQLLLNAAEGTPVDGSPHLTIWRTRIYRGYDGRWGRVGETGENFFVDAGEEPDYQNPPPGEFNPFEIYEDGEIIRTEKPALNCFHEDRRYYAATAERPYSGWASGWRDYNNHDEVDPPDPLDPFTYSILSDRNEKIRGLLSALGRLLVFTSNSVRGLMRADGGPPAAGGDLVAPSISNVGCSGELAPITAGDTVFFVNAKSVRPYGLKLNENGKATTFDASGLAYHLFQGRQVVSMAWAEDPYRVLWMARDDGLLLSCTYISEDALAFARHDIAGDGLVEEVVAKPEQFEDGVYLIVNRGGVRSLERFAYRTLPIREGVTDDEGNEVFDARYGIFMDRSVSYNGRRQNAGEGYDFTFGTDTTWEVGGTCLIDFGGAEVGGVGHKVGRVIQVDADDGGLPFKYVLETHNGGGEYTALILTRGDDRDGDEIDGTDWYYCVPSVNLLDHLNGQEVVANVDGSVVRGLVVDSGSVVIAEEGDYTNYAAVVHVGLSYVSQFASLNAVRERDREKLIGEVIVEMEHSLGGSVGTDFDNLVDIPFRSVADGYNPIVPRYVDGPHVAVPDRYATTGRVVFEQSEPMPVTILGITRVIDYGG